MGRDQESPGSIPGGATEKRWVTCGWPAASDFVVVRESISSGPRCSAQDQDVPPRPLGPTMPRQDWTRDELILALDLYFREPSARSNTSTAVLQLSELLNRLPIHPTREIERYFRNPNGVAMKLSNFSRFDPTYRGRGLTRGNQLEAVVWREFANDQERLRSVAEAIRENVASGEAVHVPGGDDDEMEAPEGAVLTRVHKVRERSRAIVDRKKKQVLRLTGRLSCEVCEFDFARVYGELGVGFAECHHTLPLSDLRPRQRTSLADLAVVCSNCHRMIHRRRPWPSVRELREVTQRVGT